MLSETESVPLTRHYTIIRKIRTEKLLHHRKCLCGCDNGGFRVELHKIKYVRRMVGLHMLNYKIIRRPAGKNRIHIVKPFVCKMCVHCIDNCGLLVGNCIRIVGHSVFDAVLTLKQIYFAVINPYIMYIVCNFHKNNSFSTLNSSKLPELLYYILLPNTSIKYNFLIFSAFPY